MRGALRALVLAAAILPLSCAEEPAPAPAAPPEPPAARDDAPRLVVIDQILIGFRGVTPTGAAGLNAKADRTEEGARKLAYDILRRVRLGMRFQELKQDFSDDRNGPDGQANGPYELANDGVKAAPPVLPRKVWAKSVGDLAFALKPGEVGVADYHVRDCPYGFHVIARLR